MTQKLAFEYFAITFLFCLGFVVTHIINNEMHGALGSYGITPRELGSAPYIFSAPFIHGNWQHLLNNLLGFVIFSTLCLTKSWRFYLSTSVFVIAVSGLMIWLFARTSTHIGASGWVFGLWAAAIAHALFNQSLKSILIAALVITAYGSMILGIFPSQDHISYEAHLFGAMAGVMAAKLFKDF